MIEIKHLTKTYGDHNAVDDLTLNVEPGRIYGFLGPNGAGKTTTMNMITGYIGSTSGEIKINGHDIFEEAEEAKKCVGYLPEFPPLYVDMTVKEYLSFAAELKKVNKAERKSMIEDVMEMTHISDMQDRLIRNLSKGYKQRVGLAQAILGYPEVIILDEPTVGLDPKQIIEIRDLIRKLGEKHTVILSSHILSEVREVCDYIFIISKGKLVASDTTENLLNNIEGSMQLEVLMEEENSDALESVRNTEDVKSAYFAARTPNGEAVMTVEAVKGKDIRKDVFKALARTDANVFEIRSVTQSLEDIFLELTGSAEAPAGDYSEEIKAFDDKSAESATETKTEDEGGLE
ncbi:MAG: ABC transporter ATP-binding protein [Lachnospiraceae bacterium]|nr:ABC transporter ATP-binding protein [Lachnospiraceae bacterium]